jgi:hypothetical protein
VWMRGGTLAVALGEEWWSRYGQSYDMCIPSEVES